MEIRNLCDPIEFAMHIHTEATTCLYWNKMLRDPVSTLVTSVAASNMILYQHS